MPRYFFDLYNDIDTVDGEGRELDGLEEAKQVALCEAREMIRSSARNGSINLNHRIEVRDAGGVVFEMYFGDAVTITGLREPT